MIEVATADPVSDGFSDMTTAVAARTPLRLSGRLPAAVAHALERRIALLDELATLQERRSEITRRVQLVGGHDNGERSPITAIAGASDPRHRLASALASVDQHERRLDELRRNQPGAGT